MNNSDYSFTHEDITAVAQQLWEDEGRPEGKAEEHWQSAIEHLRRVQSERDATSASQP